MSDPPVEHEELENEEGELLPDREAMSVLRDPLAPGIVPPGLVTPAPNEPPDLP